ncbi:AP2/ERF and B3 domain-containing transcription factor [Dendrobium catenatum]|uniref:AP2/ERF and B3 domain-containing transcription factor n=1 Tax=Dendrobium catenatum TaxID=906689 RepID=A0A2I0WMV4_9ASPA|nr:AP2/ERF and B3 domain-containing transcription factor [Dendrobium catenatum]
MLCRIAEFFPLKPSKSLETLQLFDEGSSSKIPSTEAEQRELEPVIARYKGVVLQQNGNWGAQIYVNHSRIWLGTFKSEIAAARAYDSAAMKLHRDDSGHRNFPWDEITINEPAFQDNFTTQVILEMIRDGSYGSKFIEFVRSIQSSNTGSGGGAGAPALEAPPVLIEGVICREMFQKELTPSDVGKLNRLVIPKKHATRYLPAVTADAVEEVLLDFRDRMNKTWVFRYYYWRSSQSYVFTKGWNKFVKEMDLNARDTVVFYRCEEKGGLMRRSFCMIDIVRAVGNIGGAAADNPVEDVEGVENLTGSDEEDGKSKHLMEEEDSGEGKKETKLFGVWIR